MDLQDFLTKTERYSSWIQEVRPRIVCKDGFSLSVQGSLTHYCHPRRDGSVFDSLEIGFPSEEVEELMEYAEGRNKPKDTVYGNVPYGVVEALIQKHGGIANKLGRRRRL